MNTTTDTTCDYTVPATGRTTCSHSWAYTSARTTAFTASLRRDRVARLWRLGRATDAEFATAKGDEDAEWRAVDAASRVLVAHRLATGCCR